MKVFISWSGELSSRIAKELSIWLPSIIQSVDVFYSPEDIKKGENWDARLTNELESSDYGIVCLTSENVMSPWIHFEAGVLSKKLDSKVTALMVDVVPSDIKGPLSRFAVTKLEKKDFYKLVKDINEESGNKIDESVLKNCYEVIWERMYVEIASIIKDSRNTKIENQKENNTDDILEELLQLVRKQDTLLNNPEKILPLEYLNNILSGIEWKRNTKNIEIKFEDICHALWIIMEERRLNDSDVEILYMKILKCADYLGASKDFLSFWQSEFEEFFLKNRRQISSKEGKLS